MQRSQARGSPMRSPLSVHIRMPPWMTSKSRSSSPFWSASGRQGTAASVSTRFQIDGPPKVSTFKTLRLEEVDVLLAKQERAGIRFIRDMKVLPGGFDGEQAYVHSVNQNTPAARAGVESLDLILTVNDVRVVNREHAIRLLVRATGLTRMTVRRCAWLRPVAIAIQRAWRKKRGLVRLVCNRPSVDLPMLVAFNENVTNAAVVSHVPAGEPSYTGLRAGQALLFVNGAMCFNPVHAHQLLREASGEVVVILQKSAGVDVHALIKQVSTPSGLRLLARSSSGEPFKSDVEDDCAICLQQLQSPRLWQAGCGHQFCKRCTERCRDTSDACPLCRKTAKGRSATPTILRGIARASAELV
mmetsp:Transcript_18871/g.40692  ORF Transcript_18871/g.40692 Transcript_18871/m.40692 type:complete len:357 (+) Transcript_18871:108-1178(+)